MKNIYCKRKTPAQRHLPPNAGESRREISKRTRRRKTRRQDRTNKPSGKRSPVYLPFFGERFPRKIVLKKGFLRTGECRAKPAKQTCGNRRKRKGGAKGFDNNATRMATKFFLLYAKNFVRPFARRSGGRACEKTADRAPTSRRKVTRQIACEKSVLDLRSWRAKVTSTAGCEK